MGYDELKTVSGKIVGKLEKKSSNARAPKGEFTVGDNYYVCWKDEQWNEFNVGDTVSIGYKENEWNGNISNNIIRMFRTDDCQKLLEESIDAIPVEPEMIKQAEELISEEPEKEEVLQAIIEENLKETPKSYIADEIGPNPEEYYIVMKGKRYKLIPTGDYLVNGVWKKVGE